jgi:hypothetical protein
MAATATKGKKPLATSIFLVSLVALVAAAPSSSQAAIDPAGAWLPAASSLSVCAAPAAPAIAPSYPETRDRVSGKLGAARAQVSSELSHTSRWGYEQSSGREAVGSLDAPGRGVRALGAEQPRNALGQFMSRSRPGQRIPGASAVDDFVAQATDNGFDVVGREITVNTPFGARRYDVVLRNRQTLEVTGIEIKGSEAAFSRFDAPARQQFAADRWLNMQGGLEAVGGHQGLMIDNALKILWNVP